MIEAQPSTKNYVGSITPLHRIMLREYECEYECGYECGSMAEESWDEFISFNI